MSKEVVDGDASRDSMSTDTNPEKASPRPITETVSKLADTNENHHQAYDEKATATLGPEATATEATSSTQHQQPVVDTASEYSDDEEPKLPMSKARCIALVLTLTGAAFLNVSDPDL
jgi:hypothetical protein